MTQRQKQAMKQWRQAQQEVSAVCGRWQWLQGKKVRVSLTRGRRPFTALFKNVCITGYGYGLLFETDGVKRMTEPAAIQDMVLCA